MLNASFAESHRVPWELTACGPDGEGPFRLVLHYAHGSITEYFHDVAEAFLAIESAEEFQKRDTVVPDRLMTAIPDDVNLVKQCFNEEAWANGTRH